MTALENTLALARFGSFRFGHFGGRGGSSGFLVIIGLAFAAILVWALTRSSRNQSASN